MATGRRSALMGRRLLQNALRYDEDKKVLFGSLSTGGGAGKLFALRGFKTLGFLNADRNWPNPDDAGSSTAGVTPTGPVVPEGSTSSRELENNPAGGAAGGAAAGGAAPGGGVGTYGTNSSWSSKPGTGKTWPNPNAPRDIPTYTPSSYSSSSKGGGKLWDNPNGLPYWDSKWDDPTKPELRAKGWTWDPNPANSHMGTWPADQPPPNRSPLGFSSARGGGGAWDRGPRGNFGGGGGGGFGGGQGGGFNQGGGGGFNQGGAPGGPPPGGNFQQGAPQGNFQQGAPGGQGNFQGGGGGAPGGGYQPQGGFPGGPGGGGGNFPGNQGQGGGQGGGGGFPGAGGNFQGGQGGGGGFQGGGGGAGGGFPPGGR